MSPEGNSPSLSPRNSNYGDGFSGDYDVETQIAGLYQKMKKQVEDLTSAKIKDLEAKLENKIEEITSNMINNLG